jgi:cbb3-type cytochrome oxidase subunit 3
MSTVACDGADVRKADSIATFKLTFFCVCVWAVAKAAGAKAAGKVAAGP